MIRMQPVVHETLTAATAFVATNALPGTCSPENTVIASAWSHTRGPLDVRPSKDVLLRDFSCLDERS